MSIWSCQSGNISRDLLEIFSSWRLEHFKHTFSKINFLFDLLQQISVAIQVTFSQLSITAKQESSILKLVINFKWCGFSTSFNLGFCNRVIYFVKRVSRGQIEVDISFVWRKQRWNSYKDWNERCHCFCKFIFVWWFL